jgi:ABC-type multidrug transport system fused ATPase/permease subunit
VGKVVALAKKSLSLLPTNDRRKVIRTIPFLVALSLLDLIGIVLLGTVATLTFNVVSNDSKPTRLELIFQNLIGVETSRNTLILILSIIAIILLTLKTVSQAIFGYRFAKFQARLETDLASKLYDSLLSSKVSKINQYKYSDYQYSLIVGANRYVTGIVGSAVLFVSDFFTASLMLIFAFYASPISATIAIIVFLGTYFTFNGPINKRAREYGRLSTVAYLNLGEDLLESLRGIREIKAYSKEEPYRSRFRMEKTTSSLINQKIVWLNGLIRYFLEIAILLSGTLITLGLVVTTDLKHAITVAALFIIIGFRLIPNIQRLQNSLNSFRISSEATRTLFQYFEEFHSSKAMPGTAKKEIPPALEHLEVQSVSYEFEDGSAALKDITFKLTSKNTLAILGDSGSGKSTLIDLVTGLSSPTSGHIFFHPVTGSVKFTAGTYPLSYITQNCALFGSDLYENVSLSQNLTQGDQKRIDEIVKSLNLGEFIQSNDGKAREIRADSTNISGGERQRISIARARFFDTDIVILDEPTSALDSENEKKVIQYLEEISHEKTVILVTHSRELLEISDFVLYLHEGEMIFFGSVQDFKIWENAI